LDGLRISAGSLRGAVLLLAAGLLAGCETISDLGLADFSLFGSRPQALPSGVMPPRERVNPSDPLVGFAAGATPGAEQQVALADGRIARLRLVRSYAAASGRECREILVGGGSEEGIRLVCRDDVGWDVVRPLLGGARRP
jgi:hypothetical protein